MVEVYGIILGPELVVVTTPPVNSPKSVVLLDWVSAIAVVAAALGAAGLLVVFVVLSRDGGVVTRSKPKQLPGIMPTCATKTGCA